MSVNRAPSDRSRGSGPKRERERDLDLDLDLGMDRAITRRDFLNGVGVAIGGSLLSTSSHSHSHSHGQGREDKAAYPPALTGMRGSHDGSWEVAHDLRDGVQWEPTASQEAVYDLVIVGGGISGLSAAYFYREKYGRDSRILILDNHDDFGGHAKRNEFTYEGRTFIGYGGTQSIDTPSSFSPEAMGLLKDLGIEIDRFYEAFDQQLYSSLKLTSGVFFDENTFGADRLVPRPTDVSMKEFAALAPLAQKAREDLVRLYEGDIDYMRERSESEKKDELAKTSYLAFLRDHVKVHGDVVKFMFARTHGLFGMGIDGVSALDCWSLGYPGFQGMALTEGDHPRLSLTAKPKKSEPYIFHFPDGNASIARLVVRSLVPEAIDGNSMEDIVTARMDYGALDRETNDVRIRLRSTAVRVEHAADRTAVDVVYVKDGKAETVRGRHVVLACWHSVIPALCPELDESQKRALVYAPKVPLVYTNVLIRNWRSFERLGVSSVYCPGGFHVSFSLDFPVSLGTYRHSRRPEEPIVLHLVKTPCSPGGSSREQHDAGRYELLETSFETFERETRAQLGRALSAGGFDPARDVLGITVNRWPHGYAYEYNSLWDPPFEPGRAPFEIARAPFGRVHIANSDAQAYAYTDASIDQAFRAISEIEA